MILLAINFPDNEFLYLKQDIHVLKFFNSEEKRKFLKI